MVKLGRMFLHRLINLSTTVSNLDHRMTLNAEVWADIEWWIAFLPLWNGVKLIQDWPVKSHALKFYTDASDKGFSAVYDRTWLFSSWEHEVITHTNINVRELFAIVAVVMAWGENWQNKLVVIYTDSLVSMCVEDRHK